MESAQRKDTPKARFNYRHFICTWNNPTMSFHELWDFLKSKDCTFLVGQTEKGKNGTIHYQFFCYFPGKRTRKWWKDNLKQVHFEGAVDVEASIAYCQKEESRVEGPWQFGDLKVNQMSYARKCVKELAKRTPDELADALTPFQFNQTLKAIESYRLLTTEGYPGPREGFWLYGDPGVGKTRYVRAFNPYMKPISKWWDGYRDQQEVLIDDLEKDSKFLGHYLKLWGDPYGRFIGEVKGSTVPLTYTRIWITSNYSIAEVFNPDVDQQLYDAIRRRFTELRLAANGSWA